MCWIDHLHIVVKGHMWKTSLMTITVTFSIPSSFFHSTHIVCLLSARCGSLVWGYRDKPDAVPVLMNMTFQRQTDNMHDRYSQWWCTGGRKSEGGRDAISVVREDLSAGICEPRSEGKEDGVMHRWWGPFQAVGQIKVKVRGQSVHGVCLQGDASWSAVSKGRVEGGEVREDSSGEITCLFVDFGGESGFLWSVLKICLNWFFKNPMCMCVCVFFWGAGAGRCPQEQEELAKKRPGRLCPKSQLKETVLRKGKAICHASPFVSLTLLKPLHMPRLSNGVIFSKQRLLYALK